MFKKFLEKKGISEADFEKMTAEEIAKLQTEWNNETFKELNERAEKAASKEELDKVSGEIKDFKKELEKVDAKAIGDNTEALKKLNDAFEKSEKENKEILKEQGKVLQKLQDGGLINKDFTVNKSVLRTIVEKHLTDSGLLGEEQKDPVTGIMLKEVKMPSNQSITSSTNSQIADIKHLSKKYLAQKAGENMFVGGSGTQSVFGQAVNRSPFGDIAPPLTADEHALDIFSVKGISGSLMNLLIYENLEANGELVAEGAAPSADSRIEKNDRDFKVFDFSATATISKNLLRDSGEVVDELVRQLASDIKSVLDKILFVSGGDNTNTPWGVFNTEYSCENFNPLLFTGTSKKANVISVIGKAKLQARLNNWMTDSTLVNPLQWDEIEDLKDVDENSIKDNRLAVNNVGEVVAVKGMRKYQTTKMPQGSLFVFNSNLQAIGLRQDIETQFGHNGEDLKKRKVSFVMDMRGAYGQQAKKSAIYVTNINEAIEILKESDTASLTRVDGYATGNDASELTIATLLNTGVQNVVNGNLTAYRTAVSAASGVANTSALQAIVDTVNAA